MRLEKVELIWSAFNDNQSKIEQLIELEPQLGDECAEEIERETFENAYYNIVSAAKVINEEATAATVHSSAQHSRTSEPQHVAQTKYPQINLPVFNGAYEDWFSFYDTFNSLVHNNTQLSDIEKYHYLKSCLREEAAQVIKALEMSSVNYIIAWDLLKDRFQNKRLFINNHIKGLHEIPTMSKESGSALRILISNTNTHMRALASLDQPINKWNSITIYSIVNKLDSSTRRSW